LAWLSSRFSGTFGVALIAIRAELRQKEAG